MSDNHPPAPLEATASAPHAATAANVAQYWPLIVQVGTHVLMDAFQVAAGQPVTDTIRGVHVAGQDLDIDITVRPHAKRDG